MNNTIGIRENQLKIVLLFILTCIFWVSFLSGKVSAASITANGPASVTESTAGGASTFEGKSVSIGSFVLLTLSADTGVSDSNNSSIRILYNTVGDCGLVGGKGTTEISRGPGAKSLDVHTSTVADTVSIHVYPVYNPEYTGTRTCTVTFTHDAATNGNAEVMSLYGGKAIASYNLNILDTQPAPAPTPTASTPSSTSQNSTSSSAPASETTKPNTPTTKFVDSEGNELKPAEGEKITFKDKEPIVLSGTTVPNGEVKLYIFSEPQEAAVTADEEGNGSYTIASIEPGDHRVEIEVTDPATGETSERAEVLTFSVAQAEGTDEFTTANNDEALTEREESNSLLITIVIVMILLAVSSGAGYWFWRKKHNNKDYETISSTNSTAQITAVDESANSTGLKSDDNK